MKLVTCSTLPIDFAELLRKAARQFPSQQAFATALGISTPRLNRALNKGDYPFNVVNCLRLARLTGESPSAVLRSANKAEIADLIERLYGPGLDALEESQRQVVELWDQIKDREARDAVMFTMRRLAGSADEKHPTGTGSTGSESARVANPATTRGARRTRARSVE